MIVTGPRDATPILIVDDEQATVDSLVDLLRRSFHVHATTNVDEAVAVLQQREFALVLSDQRMPKMSGSMLLSRVTELNPDTIRILFTAYSDIGAVIEAVNEGRIYYYLAKPWDPDKLIDLVGEAVRLYEAARERRELLQRLHTLGAAEAESRLQASFLRSAAGDLEQQNRALVKALESLEQSVAQMQRLGEIVPVCARCGKVKPSGGSWQDVVQYLRTETNFLSHGLCPPCEEATLREIDEWEEQNA